MSKLACVVTLGCRLNQAETALMTDRLAKLGYDLAPPGSPGVELVIVNTCAVTSSASSKSRQALTRYRKLYPQARIIAAGCAVEADLESFLNNPACDEALTNVDKRFLEPRGNMSMNEDIAGFREEAKGRFPFRSRALVKIQEGCNNFCSYCIVPYTRGPERSRDAGEVLAECRALVEAGVPELVLTGVNTCAYNDSGYDLGALVSKISAIPGGFRIRLSSTEPRFSNLALLDTLAATGDKVCRFLHLSLQHGDDAVLARMRRKYTVKEYATFAARARSLWPWLHLGTDIIVGFPGETEEEFASSLAFIEEMEFANIHIFTYSPRPGTPAAEFPGQIPGPVAKERYERLAEVASRSAAKFRLSQAGKAVGVIFETEKNGEITGWSDNYIEIARPAGFAPLGVITQVVLD